MIISLLEVTPAAAEVQLADAAVRLHKNIVHFY